MNTNIKISKTIFFALLVFGSIISASAQKYGHLNSTTLMKDLPAIKAADTELTTYQAQLTKVGEEKVAKFQANYEAYSIKANSGTISQIEAQKFEADLQKEQLTIQEYQQEVQNKLIEKRQALYDPIFTKVRKIIEQYGKDNNYTMIFDYGMGGILFENSEDLTAKIKEKL